MVRIACLVAALLAAVMLGGCQTAEESATSAKRMERQAAELKSESARPAPRAEPHPPAARNGDRAAAAPRLNGGKGDAVKAEHERAAAAAITRERPASAEKSARIGSMLGELATAKGAPAGTVASTALDIDRERMRKRGDYVAGLQKGAYTFNPPTPIKVARPITVALWVDPAKEAAQLAEEMKKTFPESAARVEAGATVWSPRMKATLTGADFEIASLDPGKDGKPFDGEKELSMTGRTEWTWSIKPTFPGTKKLHLQLSVVLPRELGDPHELDAINRDVEVEVTVWWLIDHYWEKYWKWMLGGLASAAAAAIGWWFRKRFGGSA